MEPLSALVAGIGIPVLAAGLKHLLNAFLKDRTKEVIVQLDGGRLENLTIAANADATQIAQALQTELDLEKRVLAALEKYTSRVENYHSRTGKDVDFVAQLGDKKVAIEVKNRLDRVSVDQVKRYLAAEHGLAQLLLLSTQTVPAEVLHNTKEFVDSGQLTFVNIPDLENIERDLFRALERALPMPNA